MTLPEVSPPDLLPGGERIVRQLDGIGELVYEEFGPGQWATKRGEPAKTSKRAYLLNGEELDSVSSIVGCLDKPALVRWIENQATIGAVQAERLGELVDVPEQDWCQRVRSLNLGASAKRDEGADRGTIIHSAFHTLAVEGRAPNPAEVPGVARPWVQGAIRAWLALAPEVVEAEQIVCHPEHRYAGRFDALARIDGQNVLLDYKTGKARIFDAAHWQARLYAMALEREGVHVDRIVLVGVGDDGGFELIDCACSQKAAEALLLVARSVREINAAMADQRKLARAAAKAAA